MGKALLRETPIKLSPFLSYNGRRVVARLRRP